MSFLDIYVEAVRNENFLISFSIMLFVMLVTDQWAHTTKMLVAEKRRSYFAETVLSQVHAICVSVLCCIQLFFDSEWSRQYYPYAAVVSCAYFVFHGVKYIALGMTFGKDYKMIYILHHQHFTLLKYQTFL